MPIADFFAPEGSTLFQHRLPAALSLSRLNTLLSCVAVAALTACGGGAEAPQAQAAVESAPVAAAAETFAGVDAKPTFHMAPAQLEEPADVDAGGPSASASLAPRRFTIDADVAGVSSAQLTPSALAQRLSTLQRARAQSVSTKPAGTSITAAVYTPAQIRAAYGLPVLPAAGATLSAADAAAFGAGQTIYIVDAYDNPNAFSDLSKFSTKFGLPACTNVALTASSTLPLAKASPSCTFSVARLDANGALSNTAPAYDSGWVAESALDVQWAHAIAPLARIVLIEVMAANSNNLLGGVAMANKMGAGVVSMSFGAAEGSWVKSGDATFTAAGMSYVAAAGDEGSQALWPAVSPAVLAVGGTSLLWTGAGTRYEAAWSSSGGAVSSVVALPTWQSGLVLPGTGAAKMRATSDVAFNANPTTGQYVALTEQGATTTSWNSYGGTSIGAPQWAGLLAVANARRVAASKALLGDIHATLYKGIAASAASYASIFTDVVDGSNGGCASCAAAVGFDTATGWGTPNASALLAALVSDTTSSATASTTPVVPGGAFSAQTGTAFSQSLGITAPSGVTTKVALSGAPSGVAVSTAGVVTWAAPVAGTWSFTATATTSAGKSASAKYTLSVVAVNHAPTLASSAVSLKAGAALSVKLAGKDVDGDALVYTMTGAPSGMTLTNAGQLTWAKAVKGAYAVKVIVKDVRGLSSAVATVTVTVS
jgi:subtilase family serine protease